MLENDTNHFPCLGDKEIDVTKLNGKCPMEEPEGNVMVSRFFCDCGKNNNHACVIQLK